VGALARFPAIEGVLALNAKVRVLLNPLEDLDILILNYL